MIICLNARTHTRFSISLQTPVSDRIKKSEKYGLTYCSFCFTQRNSTSALLNFQKKRRFYFYFKKEDLMPML